MPSGSSPSPPRLHVESQGGGPALVMAHGFGGSARNFRPQVKALGDAFTVVVYDARGHARSDAPSEPGAYGLESLVGDFGRVADGASAEPVVAAGLSLGAATALGFALARPERVRALVLASPPGGAEDPKRRAWAVDFARAIRERGLEAAGEEFVWGERARFDPRGAALIRAGLLEHPPHALASILEQTLAVLPGPASLATELAGLAVPVLVLLGSEDRGSAEPARALVRLLPDAELAVIPGAGHVVNLAAPGPFNERVRGFLSSADRKGGP